MENKANIIIIEGPQGVGKSTMANFLRDNLPCSNLYRLSGIKDKSISGRDKNIYMYNCLLDYMKTLEESEMNLIFDRTFFTEEVYCKLGYKQYSFDDIYDDLVLKLSKLNFNIYFVVLTLNDTSIYEKRIIRTHHNYQSFSVENSVNQQKEYIRLAENINSKNITSIIINTDDFDLAYEKLIDSIPVLKNNNIKYNKN